MLPFQLMLILTRAPLYECVCVLIPSFISVVSIKMLDEIPSLQNATVDCIEA
jgi:hypothetical protein